MRRAVLSDIHGNLHALTATLESIDDYTPDQIICLGDTVGYGAFPSECIDLVRERCSVVLAGNHDWGISGRQSLERFNSYAHNAALWTRGKLNEKDLDWLRKLPLVYREADKFFVHASPIEPEYWDYIYGEFAAKHALESTDARMVFVGHSHRAAIYRAGDRLLVNVGSVGQPRDSDPRARWGLVEDESMQPSLIAVEYDVQGAMQAIREAGLPEFLALRLESGR